MLHVCRVKIFKPKVINPNPEKVSLLFFTMRCLVELPVTRERK